MDATIHHGWKIKEGIRLQATQMIINATAGYITIEFENKDWKHPSGGASAIINMIKKEIRFKTNQNPDGFEYFPEANTWIVKDTAKNRRILEDAKKWYLTDPDQFKLPF